MKCQKTKILGSHSSFQTSAIAAEEANTLKATHYWNSPAPGEEVEGEMATHTSCCSLLYDVFEVTLLKSFYFKIINKTVFIINIHSSILEYLPLLEIDSD